MRWKGKGKTIMGMQFMNAIGQVVLELFKFKDKKRKRDINALSKEALRGTDDKRLSNMFGRVFGRGQK